MRHGGNLYIGYIIMPEEKKTDNIMLNQEGQPVNVPGVKDEKVVKDAEGNPIVPTGTEEPGTEAPKDKLARPAPDPSAAQPQPVAMPDQKAPDQIQETAPQKAVEETITFDELAAKKGFKSPDDMAKSYQNLESQNTRVEVSLADAIKARNEGEVSNERNEVESAMNAESTDDALKIVSRMIDKKVKAVEDKQEYQLHLMANPDDQKHAAKAIDIVRENPGISWGTAFDAAKGRDTGQNLSAAREEGKQEAYDTKTAKEDVTDIHGGTTKELQMTPKMLIDGIKTGQIPLAEARKIINAATP